MATVWITGASSGLGLHTAQALVDAGFEVIAGARSFSEKKVAGRWQLPLDVTDEESIDRFINAALAIAGAPDILINCAGVLILGACESYGRDELLQVLETNFLGQAAMISRVLPMMRKNGKGKIVNFSSINGLLGIPFQGAYVASKHAIEGYSECLALEDSPAGIESAYRANCHPVLIPDLDTPGEETLSKCFTKADSLRDIIDILEYLR